MIGNNERSTRAIHGMLSSIGARVRLMSPNEVRDLLNAEVSGSGWGIYEEDAGYADTNLYTNTVMSRARELGAELTIDKAEILLGSDSVEDLKLTHSSEIIKADHYVVTTGVWTPKLTPRLNLPIRNIVERVVGVDVGRPLPNIFDYVNNFYIRPEGMSNGLMGLLYPPEYAWPDPDRFNPLTQPPLEYSLNVMERTARRMPWFENARPLGGWQGLYDVTPDWMPIIDEPVRGLVLRVGLNGHGFKLAPSLRPDGPRDNKARRNKNLQEHI